MLQANRKFSFLFLALGFEQLTLFFKSTFINSPGNHIFQWSTKDFYLLSGISLIACPCTSLIANASLGIPASLAEDQAKGEM